MWTHGAKTGSTKPNTRGIYHLNAKPEVDLETVLGWDRHGEGSDGTVLD